MSDLIEPVHKRHRCDHPGCTSMFARKSDLNRHGLTHTQLRPNTCDFPGCKKAFNQKGQLKTHKNTHTGAKPHQCGICSERFGDPATRSRHKKEVHGGQPAKQCPMCNSRIKRLCAFRNHLRDKHGISFASYSETGPQPIQGDPVILENTAGFQRRSLLRRRGACVNFPFDTRSQLQSEDSQNPTGGKHILNPPPSPRYFKPGVLGLARNDTNRQQIPRMLSPFHELGSTPPSSTPSTASSSSSASPNPYGFRESSPGESYGGSITAESSTHGLRAIHNVELPKPQLRHYDKYIPLERQLHSQNLSAWPFRQSTGMTLPIDPALLFPGRAS